MKRMWSVIVIALALVAVLGLPAAAHVQDVVVYGADFQPNGKLVANGAIVCTPGETFILRINIEQPGGYAIGRANGTCTGGGGRTGRAETIGGTGWTTGQIRVKTGTIVCGPAIARVQARTQEHGARQSESFQIQVCGQGPS